MPNLAMMTLLTVILLALVFDFINGFHDTANSIATTVSTRALPPKTAILGAAAFNFLGALLSESVAKTISGGLVKGVLEQYVIISALIAAITWNLITWYIGIPSSSSHALIGGLIGASITYCGGISCVVWSGVWEKVILPLLTSPILGFVIGYIVMNILYELMRPFSNHSVNRLFSKLQLFSAAFMAFSHGKNDAQKSMGIITLALVSGGVISNNTHIPLWVKIACGIAMTLGTSAGGWRIIKTMGVNLIKLQPVNGFAAETSAAAVIEAASGIGAPVSTTHIISTAIMGVGASKRFSAVKWSLAKNVVMAWVYTIPVTALLGASVTLIFKMIIQFAR